MDKVRRCAVTKTVLWIVLATVIAWLLNVLGVPERVHHAIGTTALLVIWILSALATPFFIVARYLDYRASCSAAIDRGEPWHYWIPKPGKRAGAATMLVILALAVSACATPDPRIDAMQAELQELKAEKAKPVEPPPKPSIKTQLVKIAGVSLPKNCGFLERSDINVKPPTYAALLVCQEKPQGVEAIVAKPPAQQAPAKAK